MEQEIKRFPVLITGGAGYIGSHVALALLDEGWPVVVIDNLSSGFEWAVPEQAEFINCDIANTQTVRETIFKFGIKAIMHLAGSVIVSESITDPLKYYDNNTSKSRALIETAVHCYVPHILFSSTAATYGIPLSIPIGESAPTIPINPYGWSKLMTERMLIDAAAAHPLNFCILRYFNVAGADPHGRAGQSTVGATHLIKVAAEVATGKRELIEIYGTDYPTRDGTGIRDYIHVSDLAAAHLKAIEHLVSVPDQNLVLNCGYGRGYSVLEVIKSVERVTGRPIKSLISPRRPGDPPALIADNRLILDSLPWRPSRGQLDTIVSDALRWERQVGQCNYPHKS